MLLLQWASPVQPAPAESPQGGNAARVGGCSGVIQIACPFLFSMERVIVVTGASSGLGQSTANYLAQKGFKVFGSCRNPQKYPKPEHYSLLALDLNNPETIDSFRAAVLEAAGRVDAVVNNAGVGITGPIEELDAQALKDHFQTNLFGPTALLQAFLPDLRLTKGAIINITSIAGYMGLPFRGAYSASKGAFHLLSEALRMEVKSQGIRVMTVAPGDYATDIASRRYHEPVQADSPYREVYQHSLDTMNTHVDQGNDPEEIARAIAALLQSKNPGVHHRVGPFMQKLSVTLKRILPDTWYERLLMNHYKL